jgi:hypothetical protein
MILTVQILIWTTQPIIWMIQTLIWITQLMIWTDQTLIWTNQTLIWTIHPMIWVIQLLILEARNTSWSVESSHSAAPWPLSAVERALAAIRWADFAARPRIGTPQTPCKTMSAHLVGARNRPLQLGSELFRRGDRHRWCAAGRLAGRGAGSSGP